MLILSPGNGERVGELVKEMWAILHVRVLARVDCWLAPAAAKKIIILQKWELFPPGLNQDKNSLNPIKIHLIKSPLCVLWSGEGRLSQSLAITSCWIHASSSSLFIFSYGESFFLKKSGVASYLVILVRRWELELKLVKEKILHGWNLVATGGDYKSNYTESCSHNPTDDSCSPVFCFFARHSVR